MTSRSTEELITGIPEPQPTGGDCIMGGYTELSIIVDGALSQVMELDWDGTDRVSRVTYGGPTSDEGEPLDRVLGELEVDANRQGYFVEVYAVYHHHEPGTEEEDDCALDSTSSGLLYDYGVKERG
jgi:hypothetical protein